MLTDKKEVLSFVAFLLFLAGGFIGQGLWLILMPFCLWLLIKEHRVVETRFSCADVFVILVCLAEILSCAFSIYAPNSIRSAVMVLLAAFFWFFFRCFLNGKSLYGIIAIGGSCLAFVFSLITIITFVNFKAKFSVYDMASLTDFKQEFMPFGLPVNDWVSFLLCLLPYPFAAAFNSGNKVKSILHLLSAALLTVSVILSLSRGAYLALFAFFVISIISLAVLKRRETKRFLVLTFVVGFAAVAAVLPAWEEVLTTCAMSRTTSQKLSTAGRVQLIGDAVSLWKESPLVGVGQGNFNIVYDGTITDRKSSHTRATNVYALILVERGTVGLLAYCGLALAALIAGFKRMKKRPDIIFFEACMAAVCVRGLFFSSMFNYRAVFVLVMLIMFPLVQCNDDIEE